MFLAEQSAAQVAEPLLELTRTNMTVGGGLLLVIGTLASLLKDVLKAQLPSKVVRGRSGAGAREGADCPMRPGDSDKLGSVHDLVVEKEDGRPLVYSNRSEMRDDHRDQFKLLRDITGSLADASRINQATADVLKEISGRECPLGKREGQD